MKCIADIEGPWVEPKSSSGLVERMRASWYKPIDELSNQALATALRQRKALALVVVEVERRLERGFVDGTEQYDDELANALRAAGYRIIHPA